MKWSLVQRSPIVCVCVCARPSCALEPQKKKIFHHIFDLANLTTPSWLCYIFPQYLVNGKIFGKMLLDIKCVFWFSLQLLSETYLILRRTERDILINVYKPSCKISFIILRFEWDLNFLDRFSKNTKNQISWKSVQWAPNCPTRTDQQLDMTKLKVTFRSSSKATTKCQNKQYPIQD